MERLKSFVASVVLVLLLAAPSLGEPYFDRGVQLYSQKKFSEAARYLDEACRSSPWDSNAYYYRALCYHQLGDKARAGQAYAQVIRTFKGSQAAQYAEAALKQLDPGYYQQVMSGKSRSAIAAAASTAAAEESAKAESDAEFKSLPEQSKVYFTENNGHMIVDASVNNRPMKMIFDTGAETILIGTKQLQELGIAPPTGPATGGSAGVGGRIDTWDMPVEIRVGDIKRKLKVTVGQGDQMPLLGQTFFKDFAYEIDRKGQSIRFHKRHKGGPAVADSYAVPFTKGGGAGNEMTVTAEIGGRRCKMFFDTGAQVTLFSRDLLRSLNLEAPETAGSNYRVIGVGGEQPAVHMVLNELRMGPIVRRDFAVTVVEKGEGLIGQDFVGDWRYTVDNSNKQIKFFH